MQVFVVVVVTNHLSVHSVFLMLNLIGGGGGGVCMSLVRLKHAV